jgi:hypothetical protein
MRTGALSTAVLATALLPVYGALGSTPAVAASAAASWDTAQQRQVLTAGLMTEVGGSFAGASRLSAEQANATMTALATRLQDVLSEPALTGVSPVAGEPDTPSVANRARPMNRVKVANQTPPPQHPYRSRRAPRRARSPS